MALTQVNPGLLDSNAQYTGFKNRIINGAFGIWQRGTTYALTSSQAYGSADRFGFWEDTSASGVANQYSTSVPSGFQYAVKLGRNNAATNTGGISMRQAIETVNSFDLAGQTVTLSFYAKAGANFSSTSNTLNVLVISGTSADQSMATMGTWTGYATPVSSSCTLTTSYQQFTFTGTVSSSALQLGIWIYYSPTGTAGADDNVYVTGVQLEKGSTATSFDYRPYGTELALCQRYYEKSFEMGTAPAQNTGIYNGTAVAPSPGPLSGMSFCDTRYKVNKRNAATVTFYNPAAANAFARDQNAGVNCTATSAWIAGESSFGITASTGAGSGVTNRVAVHWSADSEL